MISIFLALFVLGAVLYVIPVLPIDETVKVIMKVLAVVCLVFWLAHVFGYSAFPARLR